MASHKIVANDEHPSWPITLGYEGVGSIPAEAAWPDGTTVVMVSVQTKDPNGEDVPNAVAKVKPAVIEDLATHDVRRDFSSGDYTNIDVGEHQVQWEVTYPDTTSETWPKAGVFDTLTVGRDLGGSS